MTKDDDPISIVDKLFNPLINRHAKGTYLDRPTHESIEDELLQLKRRLIGEIKAHADYDGDVYTKDLIGEHFDKQAFKEGFFKYDIDDKDKVEKQ